MERIALQLNQKGSAAPHPRHRQSATRQTPLHHKVGLVVAILVAALVAFATSALTDGRQTRPPNIGPDAFGYCAGTVRFSFRSISTTGTQILANHDDAFVSIPIGFRFRFYGTRYTTVFVASNGLLTFGAGDTNFSNESFTGQQFIDVPKIAPLWDDWVTFLSAADAVYYRTTGRRGERQLVVQWDVVQHFFSSPSTVTFQAVLFEDDNTIEFRYLDTDAGDAAFNFGASATVGIRDVSGDTNGRFLQWSHDQAVIGNRTAIRFYPLDDDDDDDDDCRDHDRH